MTREVKNHCRKKRGRMRNRVNRGESAASRVSGFELRPEFAVRHGPGIVTGANGTWTRRYCMWFLGEGTTALGLLPAVMALSGRGTWNSWSSLNWRFLMERRTLVWRLKPK